MAKMSLPLFLDSLSISKATVNTWERVVAEGYDTLPKILAMSVTNFSEVRRSTGGIIGENGALIHASLHSPRIQALLDKADAWLDSTPAAPAGEIAFIALKVDLLGQNVAMTGTGPRPRSELEKQLKAAGATPVDKVNKTTSCLICESATSNSSKAQAARKLGITVWGYADVF